MLEVVKNTMSLIKTPFFKDKGLKKPLHYLTHEMTFDAGHRLSNYKGKCSALHGHTYKAIITISGEELNEWGGIIDFGEIKKVAKEFIDGRYDHKTMLKAGDLDNEVIARVVPENWIVWMNANPTAENISKEIFKELKIKLRQFRNVKLESITLYETPKNAASYRE